MWTSHAPYVPNYGEYRGKTLIWVKKGQTRCLRGVEAGRNGMRARGEALRAECRALERELSDIRVEVHRLLTLAELCH
jgi:hypothetical protein